MATALHPTEVYDIPFCTLPYEESPDIEFVVPTVSFSVLLAIIGAATEIFLISAIAFAIGFVGFVIGLYVNHNKVTSKAAKTHNAITMALGATGLSLAGIALGLWRG
ncbi:MAG TPA: hypothetical protein ENF69_07285 [Euryarchaeota archaeon]|nr:hypothetical protein [Euryarchaeota archaeon]